MTANEKTETALSQNAGIKQFGTILNFELKSYLTNKIFVGITIFLMAAIIIATFFPRIVAAIDGGTGTENNIVIDGSSTGNDTENGASIRSDSDDGEYTGADGAPVMLIVSDTPEHATLIKERFSAFFPNYNITLTDAGLDTIKKQITEGSADCAFVMDSLISYTYYVNDLSMHDQNAVIADDLLQNIYSMSAMIQSGMTAEEATAVLSAQIEHETVNLGKDQVQNFFYTYIMIFALYMVILMYGQMIATNVATEKSSRAMELLITSAKPVSMMFGKVIASCLAGFIQLVAVFGTALVCFQINKPYWNDNMFIASIFDMPIPLLGYMLVFFVLGFFIYAFLYGAIGSTASKLEDINTAVMPITLLFIVAFFITMLSLANGTVDSLLMKICSYIPFTSPMAMFTRLAMSTVSLYEIAISIAILIVSVIGVGIFSAKIYRVGVLLYGTKPKMGAIIKAMKKA